MPSRKNFVRWARETDAGEDLSADIDLSDYATEEYVDDAIEAIPEPDLTGMATEEYVDDAVETAVDGLFVPASAAIYNAGPATSDGTELAHALNTVLWDTSTFTSVAGRLTIPAGMGGGYLVGASGHNTGTGPTRLVGVMKNGASVMSMDTTAQWVNTGGTAVVPLVLAAGDYLQLYTSADNGYQWVRLSLWLDRKT